MSEVPEMLLRDLAKAPIYSEEEIDQLDNIELLSYQKRTELRSNEIEALRMMSHGLTVEMVASATHFALDTIKNRLARARYLLGAKNTTHAVAIAIRTGLID